MAKFIFFHHLAIGLSRGVAFRSRPPKNNYPITRLTECSLCVYRSPSKMP